jgi:hypothetical protein
MNLLLYKIQVDIHKMYKNVEVSCVNIHVYIGSLMARGEKTHNKLDINHIKRHTMGDSFYHIFATVYLLFSQKKGQMYRNSN